MQGELECLSDKLVAIVDDNRTFVSLLRSILADFGVRNVTDFSNADDVVPFLESQFVSALFLDLVMPKMTGLQLAHQIRHAPDIRNRVMPVIMITGHADARNIQMAIKVGIDEMLVKPVRPRDVRDKLQAVVNQPRVYIKTRSGYYGPDRRRRADPQYRGPERRQTLDHEVITSNGPRHVRNILAAAGVTLPGISPGADPARVPYSAAPLLREAILKAGLPAGAAPPPLAEPEFERRYIPRPAEETGWSQPQKPSPVPDSSFRPVVPAPQQRAAADPFNPVIPAHAEQAAEDRFDPVIPALAEQAAEDRFEPVLPALAEQAAEDRFDPVIPAAAGSRVPAPEPKRQSAGRYFLD